MVPINNLLTKYVVLITFFLFTFVSFNSLGCGEVNNSPSNIENKQTLLSNQVTTENTQFKNHLVDFYLSENKKISDVLSTQKVQIEYLQQKLNEQSDNEKSLQKLLAAQHLQVKLLEQKFDTQNANEADSVDLSGIMITAAGVIVTTLAVIMAVLTFVGYKDLISKAENKAVEVATSTINEIASTEITKLIDSGVFKEHIMEAVDKVVFRDLYADPELLEEDDNDQ